MTVKNACSCIGEVDGVLTDPDCLRCMRRKLRALSLVVFFATEDGHWRLGNFQGDRPYEDAEAQFQYMLQSGLPQILEKHGKPLLVSTDREIEGLFPKLKDIFHGNSVIALSVHRGTLKGFRMAWREQSDPFKPEDLGILECCGRCNDVEC